MDFSDLIDDEFRETEARLQSAFTVSRLKVESAIVLCKRARFTLDATEAKLLHFLILIRKCFTERAHLLAVSLSLAKRCNSLIQTICRSKDLFFRCIVSKRNTELRRKLLQSLI